MAGVVTALLLAGAVGSASSASSGRSHILRVWLDGRVVRLADGYGLDQFAVLSPDGRWVAFMSDRGLGARTGPLERLWIVDSRGGRPRVVSPWLSRGSSFIGQIAWSHDSRRIAIVTHEALGDVSQLHVVGVDGSHRVVAAIDSGGPLEFLIDPRWGPYDAVVTFEVLKDLRPDKTSRHETWGVTPRGGLLFRVVGCCAAWSSGGMIAVLVNPPFDRTGLRSDVRTFDELGKFRSSFAARGFAWAPDGKRLALVTDNHFEVRDLKAKLLFQKQVDALKIEGLLENPQLWWIDANTVEISGPLSDSRMRVNTATGTMTRNDYDGDLSPNGKLAAKVALPGDTALLVVSRPDGSKRRVLHRVPDCPDPFYSLEWLPDGRSLILAAQCVD